MSTGNDAGAGVEEREQHLIVVPFNVHLQERPSPLHLTYRADTDTGTDTVWACGLVGIDSEADL